MSSWSQRREQALSLALPYWSEGVGLLFGLGTLLVAFPLADVGGSGSTVLLTLVSLAAGAGAVSAMHPDLEPLTGTLASNRGARTGARTGLLAALLGGAVVVAVTQARGHSIQLKWLAAVMSILPSAVTGMIAGAWTARVRAEPDPDTKSSAATRVAPSWGGIIVASHLVLSALGFLSPLFLPAFLEPKPLWLQVRSEPAPPPPVVPEAPPYIYTQPEGFESAPVWRWELIREEYIPALDVSNPIALSPDGKSLAHVESRGGPSTIKVVQLDTRRTVAEFTLTDTILRLAFSPNAKRILAVVGDASFPLRVFDIRSRETFQLPRCRHGAIPEGTVRWWKDDEVAFFPTKLEPTALDLDTLVLGQRGESRFWKSLTPEEQHQWRADDGRLMSHGEWPFTFAVVPLGYDEPAISREAAWTVRDGGLRLAIRADNLPYQRIVSSVALGEGVRFVHPPGSGVLLRLRSDGTDVLYFGLRPAPRLRFKLTMPWALGGAPEATGLAAKIAERHLCAFICEPLINPLNGKAIAPNRDKVKALARVSKWEGEEAELWIAEEYAAVAVGDVVADLHVWQDEKMKAAAPSLDAGWWTQLTADDFLDDALPSMSVPLRHEPPSKKWVGVSLVVTPSKPKPPVPPPSTPEASTKDPVVATQEPAPAPPSPPSTSPPGNAIEEFVNNHHRIASKGDVLGMVADYAPEVSFFDHGVVDRGFIANAEHIYHAKLSKQLESVEEPINVVWLNEGLYEVKYRLVVRWTKTTGEQGGGKYDITLKLRAKATGFEITSHKSISRP